MKQLANLISLDVDLDTARGVELRSKGIRTLPSGLEMLLKAVRKLDLAGNAITDVAPLSSLPFLSNLNVSGNPGLGSLSSLRCPTLVVLSVANCGLTSIKGVECCAETLRTLIANDNALQLQAPEERREDPGIPAEVRAVPTQSVAVGNFTALSSLTSCETVVLTRNPTLCALWPADDAGDADGDLSGHGKQAPHAEGGEADEAAKAARRHAAKLLAAAHPLSVFEQLTRLKKLSLSECNLSCLPARWFLPMVTELRLAKNALRSLRPEGVIVRSLKILDVSHNQCSSIATLRRCRYVQKLGIRGNPLVDMYIARDREEEKNVAAEGQTPRGPAEAEDTAADTAAHAVPLSLQRSLKRMLTMIEVIDGQPLLEEEKLVFRRRPRSSGNADREGDEPASDGEVGPAEAHVVRKAQRREQGKSSKARGGEDDDGGLDALSHAKAPRRTPRRQEPASLAQRKAERDEETLAKVRAEAEEKDVVVEAPAAIAKEANAPVVRRERTALVPKKKAALSGEAAVAALLRRKTETQSW